MAAVDDSARYPVVVPVAGGVPQAETDVIEAGTGTPPQHGIGVGL